jgi:hypothetical protein
MLLVRSIAVACCLLVLPGAVAAQPSRQTAMYERIKPQLDAVPAIDTHDHLWPFDRLPAYVETEHGKAMTLYGVWAGGYYRWINPLTPWTPRGKFEDWWAKAKHDFANARATSFYRRFPRGGNRLTFLVCRWAGLLYR